jgi:hypothetical protein
MVTRISSSLVAAALLALASCGQNEEFCVAPALELWSSEGATATYELAFNGATCEIAVPGVEGFADGAPDDHQCSSKSGSLTVTYLVPNEPGCIPTSETGGSVQQGDCFEGPGPRAHLSYEVMDEVKVTVSSKATGITRAIDLKPRCGGAGGFAVDEIDLAEQK